MVSGITNLFFNPSIPESVWLVGLHSSVSEIGFKIRFVAGVQEAKHVAVSGVDRGIKGAPIGVEKGEFFLAVDVTGPDICELYWPFWGMCLV